MPSVNKVIFIGHMTKDPQVKQLPTQSMVAEFGMALNRKFKGSDGEEREEVCFVDCDAFGRQAEVIQKYCKKGKLLYVEGRLRYDTWEDKNGGGKRSKLSVVVENFQFLGGREDGERQDERGGDVPRPSVKNWDGAKLPGKPTRPAPQNPFGDEQQFKEADF